MTQKLPEFGEEDSFLLTNKESSRLHKMSSQF